MALLGQVTTTGGAGTLQIGASSASGAVEVFGTVAFRNRGPGFGNDSVGVLDLRGSAVTQSAGGSLNVRGVGGEVGAGGMTLGQTGNTFDRLGPITASGPVQLVTTRNLTVADAVNVGAGALTLRSDGTIGQLSNTVVTAGTLAISGANLANSGTVTLDQANLVSSASVASSSTVDLRSAAVGGLTVSGLTANGDSALRGDASLTVSGAPNIGAANRLDLRSDGAIQVAGAITATSLAARGASVPDAASIQAVNAGNAFSSFTGRATGSIDVRSGAVTLAAAGVSGNGVSVTNLQAGGTLNVTAALGGGAGGVTLTADRMTIGAGVTGASIDLLQLTPARAIRVGGAAPGDDPGVGTLFLSSVSLGNLSTTGGAGTLRIGTSASSGPVDVFGTVAFRDPAPGLGNARVGVLDLRGSAVGQTAGGDLNVAAVAGVAGAGGFVLDQPGNLISGLGAVASAQDVRVFTAAPLLTVSGAVTAADGAVIALEAPRIVTQSGGTLGFGSPGNNGTVTLRGTGSGAAGGVSLGADVVAGTGAVTLEAAGDAAIAQSAGTLLAATVTARGLGGAGTSVGSVALGSVGNAIGTLPEARAAGTVSVRSDARDLHRSVRGWQRRVADQRAGGWRA